MPHLIIEYSANLESDIDFEELTRAMHEAAVGIDTLPPGGIRTRAARRDNYRVADGHPANGFISLTLRMAEGRPPAIRRIIGDKLFGGLRSFTRSAYEKRPLSLSFEIQEIDPERRWKQSNIRDYMAQRRHGRS